MNESEEVSSKLSEIERRRMNNRLVIQITVLILSLTFILLALLILIKYINSKNLDPIVSATKAEFLSYKSPIQTNEYRLPKDLLPYHYDLKVITNFNVSTKPTSFNGTVKIDFHCQADKKQIVLNANKLIIKNETIEIVDLTDGKRYEHLTLIYDIHKQILTIPLSNSLKLNRNYSIYIEYQADVFEDNAGFYRVSYLDNQNQEKWILTSHMQTIYARKAFPCFDEPWMKAQFKITVVHHKSNMALSNMPILYSKETLYDSNLTETSFQVSVAMSTYLVALVISDFKCKYKLANAGVNGNVNVSVCGREDAYDRFDFALNNFVELLEEYEALFGLKYPFSKCDNVGIPEFIFLGMENWGLITYKESYLFVNNNVTNYDTTGRMCYELLIHEIAHIWFGNFVTPEWWDSAWLSEGFASYLQLEAYEMFNFYNYFHLDAFSTSYPISMPVSTLIESELVFNEMTYIKASLVLRMLQSLIGNTLFNKCIQAYLNQNKYGYVNANDLYIAFQNILDKQNSSTYFPKLENFMKSWILMNGYPIVHVHVVNSTTIRVSQEYFLYDSNGISVEAKERHKWYVPFTYFIQNEIKSNKSDAKNQNIFWMLPNETEKIITLSQELDETRLVIGNKNLQGFYRVNYDENNWNKIIKNMGTSSKDIPYDNRVQILNDVFALARSGILNVTKPLEMLNYIKSESDSFLSRTALANLKDILNLLQDTVIFKDLRDYLRNFFKSSDTKTSIRKSYARSFPLVCELDLDDSCKEISKSIFKNLIEVYEKNGSVSEMLETVSCTGLKYSTIKEWEIILKLSAQKTILDSKNLILSLGCTRDPILLERYLYFHINSTQFKKSDSLVGLLYASKLNQASGQIWNFMKNNWEQIYEKLGASNILEFNQFFGGLTDSFHTNEIYDDFVQFFSNSTVHEALVRQVTQSIEKMKGNIKWKERFLQQLPAWLLKKQ